MDLKENLQHFRKRQGLSQIELAEALAVSRQTISKWETGAALPSAENLAALGQLYGVAVDQLLHGGGAEPGPVPPERSPALPPPEAAPSPRRSVWGMVGAVLLFDLLMFLLQFYLFNLKLSGDFFLLKSCTQTYTFYPPHTTNGGVCMNDNKTTQLPSAERPAPRKPDLDDLIFQGEGWLASDR